MEYVSTRSSLKTNSVRAVLSGIAPDGGLFVCPSVSGLNFDWKKAVTLGTRQIAVMVMSQLLDDFNDIPGMVERAYSGKFEMDDLVPLKKVGDRHVLELFRGPTCAFKDVALSMLPVLMTGAMKQCGSRKKTVILTATSGDTGKAALEGFHDVDGTQIFVFYPYGGVSPIQQAQMTTQEGCNVNVCAVRGNFDDCQTGVKKAFANINDVSGENSSYCLSSANSINIGRLVPQIVYYFSAYRDMMADGTIRCGEPVDFVVPTGNFGDILAGYMARSLGLPVGKLVCASNENNVLTDFLTTGIYDKRRTFHMTDSPSMDILVSSNLERLLYLESGCDADAVSGWMRDLSKNGYYKIDSAVFEKIRSIFAAYCASSSQTSDAIKNCFEKNGYLCDPHTAVAWHCADEYMKGSHNPVVVLSTASPYKFPVAVCRALGIKTGGMDEFSLMDVLNKYSGVKIPASLSSLKGRKVLHNDVINVSDMESYILSRL